jgi:hypothetical protein
MSARDVFHEPFTRALLKDGWTITHDPLTIPFDGTDLFVDIGAERLIGAERDGERIAVEIKSFLKPSPVQDLKESVGQYILYSDIMAESPANIGRTLYLAVREETYRVVFGKEQTQRLLRNRNIRLIVFDPEEEVLIEWKS